MLDRTVAPLITNEFNISFPSLNQSHLKSGHILNLLFSDTVEVFRLEIEFPFGVTATPSPQVVQFFPNLLGAGTMDRSALEISEAIDALGGFFNISMRAFSTTLTLHGLSKYFEDYLPILTDILENAQFPQDELDIAKEQALQRYLVNKEKTSFWAEKVYKEVLYGADHPMGMTPDEQIMKSTTRLELMDFYENIFKKSRFKINLCGNITKKQIENLDRVFTTVGANNYTPEYDFPKLKPSVDRTIEIDNSVQSTLIIGKRLFNRKHPDFHAFLMANTLLGGYFGSRLMKNIREEKGLTYGISSSLVSNTIDGVFSIKADLNKEKLDEARAEIEKEIEILKTIPVPESELETVKTYINGSLLNGVNTIFDIMDKHKAIAYEGLPEDFYESLPAKIREVQAEDIMRVAQKYLNDFSTIIAG